MICGGKVYGRGQSNRRRGNPRKKGETRLGKRIGEKKGKGPSRANLPGSISRAKRGGEKREP